MVFEYSWYFFNVQMYNDCQSERFLQFTNILTQLHTLH